MDTASSATLIGMADTQRPRMIFDCSERLRRAIRIKAGLTALSPSEVIVHILEAALTDELKLADRSIAAGDSFPPTKRGRKPGKEKT